MVAATLIGVGALLLPVPETYQVVEVEPPKVAKKPAAPPRPAPRAGKDKGPAKAPSKPAPPAPKLPTSDTTKGRLTPPKK